MANRIKRAMKMTSLGLLPDDWDVRSIKDCTDVVTGATPSTSVKEFWDGDIPWMSSGELNKKYIDEVDGRITQKGYDNCGTHMVPSNCVLIGLAGQGKTRGTAAINHIPLCTNQSIGSILPKQEFDSLFLFHYLDSQYNQLRLLSAGDGGRGGLNKQLLLNILFPFPYISEQRKIGKVLTETDNLIIGLDRVIRKKKLIKRGTMQQLLSGNVRLKGYSESWIEKTIGDIGYTYSGITGKCKADFGHGNSHYITFLNVLNNPYINTDILESVDIDPISENQNEVRKGDLFFNTSSETPEDVGTCSTLLTDVENVYLNSFCFGYRLEDEEMSGLFLSYYFRSAIGRKEMTMLAQGATRYNLSKENFNKIVVTVPPTKKEQDRIAGILTAMDKEIAALEAERDKYKNIKQGMMQKLLTGQIRLPV